MKRGGPLRQKTPMKPGNGFAPRSAPMARGTARLTTAKPLARKSTLNARAPEPGAKPKRSRGLKGRTPTAAEQRFMDAAGTVPCLACTIDGRENRHTSLHHIDGRTKQGAHFLVLPLCGPHHQQDDSDPLQRPSLHGRKATFTARYGTEAELLASLRIILGLPPF